MSRRVRILVSNDDGILAPGIAALADAMAPLGEVWVVAPDREQSAKSHSLTLHHPLRLREVAPRRYAVDGTPTDSVFLGIHHLLKGEVDLVVSGFNHGANLGDDVIYSGTVAAAREGALLGYPSIAFSMVGREPYDFDGLVPLARSLAEHLLSTRPGRLLLNVNAPNLPHQDLRGVLWTFLGRRRYANNVEEKLDPRGRSYFWIGGGPPEYEEIPGSDCTAVVEGFISVTPLSLDMTHHQDLAGAERPPLRW